MQVDGLRIDFSAVMAHVQAAIAAIEPHDSAQNLTAVGVGVVHGTARFTGPTAADIDGRAVTFRQALVATGSEPLLPPVPGLAHADPLTSDTVWSCARNRAGSSCWAGAVSAASWVRPSRGSARGSASSRGRPGY